MKSSRLCVEINNPILNTVINMKDKVYVALFWLVFVFILFVGLNFPYLLIAVLVIPYFIFECIKEKRLPSLMEIIEIAIGCFAPVGTILLGAYLASIFWF